MKICLSVILVLFACAVEAQFLVMVASPKIIGQKVVVPLLMKNGLSVKIESARAAVFLVDEQGKMLGQASRWVIGGSQDKPGLPSGATNTFNFVITTPKPITTTNLTAKLSVTRIVLEGGKLADVAKEVVIQRGGQ